MLTASNANITGDITATSGALGDLSITGDLTMSGGSLIAGGGNVVIDGSGIAITSGTGSSNIISWSDGGYILSNGGVIRVANVGAGTRQVTQLAGGQVLVWGSNGVLRPDQSGSSLGDTTVAWDDAYIALAADSGTTVELTAANRLVKNTSSTRYKKGIEPWNPTAYSRS